MSIPALERLGRRCCGSRSRPRSAVRSASSASCATARPGSARTCSSRSARRSSRSSPRTASTSSWRAAATIVRADPTRIAAQIVTGIGFLGAGAIIREGLSVRGLTTAATLWVVAAIGMACGAGYYWPAVAATVLTIFALWPLRFLAYRTDRADQAGGEPSDRRADGRRSRSAPLLAQLGDVRHFEVTDEADRRVVQLELARASTRTLVARLSDLDVRDRRAVAAAEGDALLANPHKLAELRAALPGLGARAARGRRLAGGGRRRPTTTTRASRRASAAPRRSRTRWVLGEDSGIECAALGGAPGRRTRRAGPSGRQVEKLLARARRRRRPRARGWSPSSSRSRPDGEEVRGSGVLEGEIARERGGRAAASATTRSSSRAARRGRSPSSATTGSARTRTAARRRRRCAPRSRSRESRVARRSRVGRRARSRRAQCQLTSAPSTITFAIT